MEKRKPRSIATPLALAGLGAMVLALTVNGASAVLSAQTNNPTVESVNAGTLNLSMADNGAGFSQGISNIAPGDTVNRYVNLTNSGTLDGRNLTLAVTGTGSQSLIADGTSSRALKLTVKACSVAWDATAGTCAGTSTTLLTGTTLASLAGGVGLESVAFNSGQSRHLQLSLALPDQNETTTNGITPTETVQGQTTQLSYNFGITQRTAATSSN